MQISLPPQLSQFGRNIATIEREAEAKRAELEQAVAHAKEIQQRLSSLQRNVDEAADRLARADAQFSTFKAGAETMRASAHEMWGIDPERAYRPTTPDYSTLVAFDAAIADYPRVRELFQRDVATAEAALSEFEREHLQPVS